MCHHSSQMRAAVTVLLMHRSRRRSRKPVSTVFLRATAGYRPRWAYRRPPVVERSVRPSCGSRRILGQWPARAPLGVPDLGQQHGEKLFSTASGWRELSTSSLGLYQKRRGYIIFQKQTHLVVGGALDGKHHCVFFINRARLVELLALLDTARPIALAALNLPLRAAGLPRAPYLL